MSLDLRDIRSKISVRAHCVFEAESRESGEELSAIIRAILEEHAEKRLSVARVADALLRREGLPGICGEGKA